MADTNQMSAEAAKALFDAILKQSELLGTWSLAVFGAGILLVTWYVQRQLDPTTRVTVMGWPFVWICIVCEGASILLMYVAYGIIVNLIPELQFSKLETSEKFYGFLQGNKSFSWAQIVLTLQFLSFFAGIVFLGAFGVRNVHLMRPQKPQTPTTP